MKNELNGFCYSAIEGEIKMLEDMKVKELRNLAKELNIIGRWRMNRRQLLSAIETAESNLEKAKKVEKNMKKKEMNKIDTEVKKPKSNNHNEYLKNITVGDLIAFVDPVRKRLETAKVVKKSNRNDKLKVETSYKLEFVIESKQIIWVKTGKRWPVWIYNVLKGKSPIETIKGIELND